MESVQKLLQDMYTATRSKFCSTHNDINYTSILSVIHSCIKLSNFINTYTPTFSSASSCLLCAPIVSSSEGARVVKLMGKESKTN